MSDNRGLPADAFDKQDRGDDLDFYRPPRLVTHIDDGAIAALTSFYRATLPAGGRILDVMSSWVSHLPDNVDFAEVVGHGMNAVELAANPRLTRWFVQDFNADPLLPLDDDSFDASLCCVGIQYLQRPFETFREMHRVLVPGAPFFASFSNRCFPTKAVAIWQSLDMQGQARLIAHYLRETGFTAVRAQLLADGARCDPLIVIVGTA